MLLTAAEILLSHATLDGAPARIAIVLGTALGGVDEWTRALRRPARARRRGPL